MDCTPYKNIPEEHTNVLKGDTPFDIIIENITNQFNEFDETGYVMKDKTNYIDIMNESVNLTEQINQAAIDEYEVDYGETVIRMKELFNDLVMNLMEVIGVDLYQVDDPCKVAYIIYTNFMLTSQREGFFEYVLSKNIDDADESSDLKIAYRNMITNPDNMYHQIEILFDGNTEKDYIISYLDQCGYSEILDWVADGFIPISIIYDIFLIPKKSLSYMFIGYYEKESSL